MGVAGNLAVGRGLVRTRSRRSLLGEETQAQPHRCWFFKPVADSLSEDIEATRGWFESTRYPSSKPVRRLVMETTRIRAPWGPFSSVLAALERRQLAAL